MRVASWDRWKNIFSTVVLSCVFIDTIFFCRVIFDFYTFSCFIVRLSILCVFGYPLTPVILTPPMPETLITITDAASISGKSIQTIRRAIKAKKIKVKKQKTPQGFNYLIIKDTLVECYQLGGKSELREIPIERHADEPVIRLDIQETTGVIGSGMGDQVGDRMGDAMGSNVSSNSASGANAELEKMRELALTERRIEIARTEAAMKDLDGKIGSLVNTYSNEREQITQVLKDFKDRILVLENQIRLLQAPKKKWYQLWS